MNRKLLKKAAVVASYDPEVAYDMVVAATKGEEWYKEEDLDRTFGALNRTFSLGLYAPLKGIEHEKDAGKIKNQLSAIMNKADEVHVLLGKLGDILPL